MDTNAVRAVDMPSDRESRNERVLTDEEERLYFKTAQKTPGGVRHWAADHLAGHASRRGPLTLERAWFLNVGRYELPRERVGQHVGR